MSEGYEFGSFRLDCRRRELRRSGELVALTPKAFDLLRALVTAGDRVIEKKELLELVWPDSFVSDDSLTQHITALRKALGDTPDRPAYILTVQRHGYRFIAPIRAVSDDRPVPTPPKEPNRPSATQPIGVSADGSDDSPVLGPDDLAAGDSGSWRRRGAWMAALIVTILMAIALGGWMFSPPRATTTPEILRFTISPPEGTTFSPSASSVAVSPDGRLLAFLAYRPSEETRIWVRSLDSLRARELRGTDGALGPFWSPDSRYLGFIAHEQLKTVSLIGEPPKTLYNLQPGNSPSGTWSREGVILFSNGKAISRVPATGGTPTSVTAVDEQRGERAHLLPHFLPDGRHFLYVARGAAGGSSNNWVVLASLDGSERRPLIRAPSQALYADAGYLLFLENGALLAQPFDVARLRLTGAPLPVSDADQIGFNPSTPRGMFSISDNGLLAYRLAAERELGWFDREGRPLGSVGAAGRDSNPALSPDGRHLAVNRYDPATSTRGIWVLDLERSGVATQVTTNGGWATCPVWSPDSTRLVFASGQTASASQLYEKSLTESTEVRTLAQHTNACPLEWSRDGQFVLSGTSRDMGVSESGLWVVPLHGQSVSKSLPGPWPRRVWAHVSPDGRWMAYVSDSSGRYEVFVRAFPLGNDRPWRISSSGGIEPQWRADGRELFYISANQQLMAVAVTTEGRFEAGTAKALFATGLDPIGIPISGRNQYVVGADGTRFLLNQPRPDAPPAAIVIVRNWQSALGAHELR